MKKTSKPVDKEQLIKQIKIDLLTAYFPFSNEDIIKYKEVLNFDEYQIFLNPNINWNTKLIKTVKDKLAHTSFWKLKNISLDISFFNEFDDIIDYSSIQLSKNIVWNEELIINYGDKFDWSKYLINKENLCTIQNIRRFKDKFDWDYVSQHLNFPIDDEFIEEFKDLLNWSKLSLNKNLLISLELLEKYKDNLDFENLSRNPACIDIILKYPKSKRWNWNNVIINPGIKYDDEIFELVFHYYSTQNPLSSNKHQFYSKRLISNFLKRIFHSPFTDKTFFLNDRFIPDYPWEFVSKSNIVFSKEFLYNHIDKFDFKEADFLKYNGNQFDAEFIQKNINRFDLDRYNFYYLNIDYKIIENNSDKINWFWLSSSESLDWNWDFLLENFDKFHLFRIVANKKVYKNLIQDILSVEEVYNFLDDIRKST